MIIIGARRTFFSNGKTVHQRDQASRRAKCLKRQAGYELERVIPLYSAD